MNIFLCLLVAAFVTFLVWAARDFHARTLYSEYVLDCKLDGLHLLDIMTFKEWRNAQRAYKKWRRHA